MAPARPKTPVPVRASRNLPRRAAIYLDAPAPGPEWGQIGAAVALIGRPTARVQVAGVSAQRPAVRVSPWPMRLRRLSPAVRRLSHAWFFVVPR